MSEQSFRGLITRHDVPTMCTWNLVSSVNGTGDLKTLSAGAPTRVCEINLRARNVGHDGSGVIR